VASVALVPALALLAGVSAGIALATPIAAGWVIALWIVAAGAWVCRLHRTCAIALAAGFVVAGVSLGGQAAAVALTPPIRSLLDREVGGFALSSAGPPSPHEPFVIQARLLEDATAIREGVSARVALKTIAVRGVATPVGGTLRVAIGGAVGASRASAWRSGRTIELPVTFRRPARYLNDGVRDIERDLALDGVALNASAKSGLLVRVVEHGTRYEEIAADIRAQVRSQVDRRVGRRDSLAAGIVTAILIGDRSGLPDDVRVRLQAAGTYHVIAISGGNIAILAALFAALFVASGTAGRLSAAMTVAGLLAYAGLVDAGPSVWRATATAVAYLSARLFDHKSPPWNAMAVSACVLATVAPLDVRDAGFALTFGATAAIVEAARRLRGRMRGPLAWVAAGLVASIAAELALLPIAARTFSRVTFAGLVLNVVAVPLMTIAQVAGLAVVGLSGIDILAEFAGAVAAASARGLVESAALVDVAPWLAVRVPAPALVVVAAYYLGLATVLWSPHGRRIGAAVAAFCALLILAGAAPAVNVTEDGGRLRLTMFDVGQGEALLLQTPAGRALMIDTGGVGIEGAAFDIGGRVLAPALWARGVRRLDAVAITHGDPDHIGGAAAIVRDFTPSNLWEGVPVPRHFPSEQLRSVARATGVHVTRPAPGARLDTDGVQIRVLHPPPPDWERQRVRNDDSLVVEVRYGEVAMLLTGDVSADIERAILPLLTPARVRVLKVAHHGSRTSTSRELLDAWHPQIALISCGRGNRFGHPAPDVMERLTAAGVRIYRTDRDGQITLMTDGKDIDVRTFTRGRQLRPETDLNP